MVRVEVLDEDKRHAGVARQVGEELLIGFETARRRADADDRKRTVTVVAGREGTLVVLLGHGKFRLGVVWICVFGTHTRFVSLTGAKKCCPCTNYK